MLTRVLKSMMFTALAALMAIPAVAQIRADIGSLHIRIASSPPPRAQYERRPARPHRDSVWINGYWHRWDDRWDWVSGRWDQPNNRGSRWVKARYVREGCPWYRQRDCGWRYEPAHWSDQRLVEGDDYRQWRNDRSSKKNRGRGRN